jgi:hypothetical protein
MPSWRSAVLVAVGFSLLAANTQARTWRVEKDGSGDFSVIQGAVDASASGDTIHVGPGRYNEGHIVTCPGWTEFVRVLVTKSELTFIGSGQESIIGQESPWDLSQGRHKGIVAAAYWGNNTIHIQDLSFDNVSEAIYAAEATVEIANSTFLHNRESVNVTFGGGLWIRNCRFEFQPGDGCHVFSDFSDYCDVRDCIFILDDSNIWGQGNLQILGAAQAIVENCTFLGGDSGVTTAYPGITSIYNCHFQNQTWQAMTVELGATVSLTNCDFLGINRLTRSETHDNHIIARNCVFDQVGECTIRIGYTGSIDIQDCDLGRGVMGIVYLEDWCTKTPMLIDMRNNYWGTDSADSIQAWIRDSHDSAQACGTVLCEPFEGSSTPTHSTSWGALKSLFR